MTYIVNISYDTESDHWHAIGENLAGLAMGAGSLDLLIERTNLAISDLLEINDFSVEYKMNHKIQVRYG